jgi:hypothetical protein
LLIRPKISISAGVERPYGRLNTTSNGIDGRRVSRRLATAYD